MSLRPIPHACARALARVASLALCASLTAHALLASAQTSPAHGPLPSSPPAAVPATENGGDAMPLADYLALLQQIAPAAEDGARTYLAAARLRCGRELSTAELRRAMAREGGDPVLMGLIRAAHEKDRGTRQQLVAQVQCPRGGMR